MRFEFDYTTELLGQSECHLMTVEYEVITVTAAGRDIQSIPPESLRFFETMPGLAKFSERDGWDDHLSYDQWDRLRREMIREWNKMHAQTAVTAQEQAAVQEGTNVRH